MINKFIGIGNLGKDPEIRYTQSSTAVCNFTVACESGWGDKKQTEWVRIVAFGKLAEICGEYLAKGSRVYIEGRLQTRSWEDRDGNKRYTTEVVINEMKMLGEKQQKDETDTDQYAHPLPDDDDTPF